MNEVSIVSKEELSFVEGNSLTVKQLDFLLSKTPAGAIKKRPGKGGGQWAFVSGTYVRKVLNLMFGWDWDFEVLSEQVLHGEVVVKGRLTCRVNGRSIVKTQFGNKEIATKRQSDTPLSIGNDFKAAATDALKKCAFDLGIAQDVYNPDEFREAKVEDFTLERLVALRKDKDLDEDTARGVDEISADEESAAYKKAILTLEKL
jgi:hypothetical protein